MKLAEALAIVRSVPSDGARLPVALLCGFTPLHLETFLRAHLATHFPGRVPETHVGLYDDLAGSLERVPEVSAAVVVIEWPDLDARLGLRRAGGDGWDPARLDDILNEAQ